MLFRSIKKQQARKDVGKGYREFSFHKLKDGYLVVSGDMNNKKNDWLISFPLANAKPIPVPEQKIKDYKNDANRTEKADLLKELKEHPEGVPCFYVRASGTVACFGHTPMFRLAYEKTIGEHISQKAEDSTITDMAQSIFGNEKTFAGRVFFENGLLEPGQTDVFMEVEIPKILSSPKPTTFQHYLVQTQDECRNLDHWNGSTAIRGNKLYWHQSGESWQETQMTFDRSNFHEMCSGMSSQNFEIVRDEKGKVTIEIKSLSGELKKKVLDSIGTRETQHTKIRPVRPKVTFRARIRFENLTDEELGALLFALQLPEGCCHKLGMAKPLGLGTVRITPKLFLSDRKARYSDLFAEWVTPPANAEEKIAGLKEKFEAYILSKIEKTGKLWETERLKELRKMLDVQAGKKLEREDKTRYMQIEPKNQFKDRPVLPKPSQA